MKSLGSTLRQSRELATLTLREVEEVTGISNAYLSQLENDKIKRPSASVLYKLASVYKIELDTLLVAAGIIEKTAQKKQEVPVNQEWLKRLAFYSDNLSEDQKNQVLDYLKFLKSQKRDD